MDNEKNMYNDFFDKKKSSNKGNKGLIVLFVVIGLIIVSVGLFIAYTKFIKKDKKTESGIKLEDNVNYEKNSKNTFIYFYKSKSSDVYYATNTYGQIGNNVKADECELVKKYKCENKDCTYNGSSTNFMIVDGDKHFTYNALNDKIIDTSGEINIYSDEKIKIGIVDSKYLYVNGQKIDFYNNLKITKSSYLDENSFYESKGEKHFFDIEYDGIKTELLMGIDYVYEVMDDVIYVSLTPLSTLENYQFFVDINGKILQKINGENADITLSEGYVMIDYEKLGRSDKKVSGKVDGNELYFNVGTDNMLNSSVEIVYCNKKESGSLDEMAIIVDKITYLGNGEFQLDKAISTKTYQELGVNPEIDCSKIVIK